MTAALQALAERLEKATGPDEELAFDLWRALTDTQGVPADVAWRLAGQPNLLSSLDAAIALCERVKPECAPAIGQNVHHGYWHARLSVLDNEGGPLTLGEADAPTPALALVLAIVRARIAEEAE